MVLLRGGEYYIISTLLSEFMYGNMANNCLCIYANYLYINSGKSGSIVYSFFRGKFQEDTYVYVYTQNSANFSAVLCIFSGTRVFESFLVSKSIY